MPLPNGWTRSIHRAERARVEWKRCNKTNSIGTVIADHSEVYVFGVVAIYTIDDREAFISILNRAWRQRDHLKANPGLDPLPEDQEEFRVVCDMAWFACTGCRAQFQTPLDHQVAHLCKIEDAMLVRIDPKTGLEIV